MYKSSKLTRGSVFWILALLLLLISGEALAQFQLRSAGFSALGGTSSATGTTLLAVGGQPHPIGTSSNANFILNPGFIPTLTRVSPSSDPVVSAISPNTAQPGQTLDVTITGDNFVTGATVALSGTGITVNSANVTGATQIVANLSIATTAPTGSRDVTVTNLDGKSGIGPGLFTVSGATIQPVVISPQQVGAEFNVDITVTNVQNLFGISFVLNYDTSILDVVTPTSTSVVAGPFLGNDIIFFPSVDEAGGKVSIGITRTGNQSGVNGSGIVASVKFKSLAGTPSGTVVEFSLSNVAANDPASTPIALAALKATLTLNAGLIVWPGDTDNNGVVNQADVLPLGLCFGQTGPPRQNASSAWIGQSATPWSNIKCTYADANGDGSVNQADVLPIGINFGKTHTAAAEQHLAKGNSLASAATLKPDVNPPQQAPGTEFFIKIRASGVADLFGASFELIYDRPSLMQILAVEPDSMLGSDVIFFSNVDAAGGKVSVGITKKSGQTGANGTGSVARIKAIITAQAKNGDFVNLSLQNVSANNSTGQAIEMTPQSSQIVVMTTAVASNHDTHLITEYRLYPNHPNPFNPGTSIQYDIPKAGSVTVKVYNSVGQEVQTLVNEVQPSGAYHINWDGRDEQGRIAPSGIYFYHFQAGSFSETRKMILLR